MGGMVSGASRRGCAVNEKVILDKGKLACAEQLTPAADVKDAVSMIMSASFHVSRKGSLFAGTTNKEAATSLHRIAQIAQDCDEARRQIIQEGGVRPLVELYRSGKLPEVKTNALWALSELCKSEGCREHVLEQGGLEPMLEGLESKHPEIREAAIDAVCSLSDLVEAQHKFVEGGAVTRLLNFLEEDIREGEWEALKSLSLMSAQKENLYRMTLEGAVPVMFNIVHSSVRPPANKLLAVEILSRLCECEVSRQIIVKLNGNTGLQRIIALLSRSSDQMAMHAAIAVSHIARGDDALRCEMIRLGAPQGLKHILHCKTTGPVIAALDALLIFAGKDEVYAAQVLGRLDGLGAKVVKLHLTSGSQAVAARAGELLKLLGTSSSFSAGGGRGKADVDSPRGKQPFRSPGVIVL